jgi:murein DD-endopeptidase MepM/ murein hydrolase activator NlpD
MANLRYARSGHRTREITREETLEQRFSSSTARTRLVAIALAVLLPVAIAALVPKQAQPGTSPGAASEVVAEVAVAALPAPAPAPAPAPEIVAELPPEPARVTDKLGADEALSSALARHNIGADDVSGLVRSLKGHLDVRTLRAGLSFTLETKPAAPRDLLAFFELKTLAPNGVPRTLRATRVEPAITDTNVDVQFQVESIDAPIETKLEGVAGTVRSSLYQSMINAGEDAVLVDKFVDVFAWNIDFYRQTQNGDEFRVLVEKQYAGGRFLGYGKVHAAEYVNAGRMHRGFLFTSKDGKHFGTYDDAGDALQRTFLKSPMEIARLTSSYGMRFHPVLGRNKKHEGVDYGAPTGTPVWSVADGVVKEARYSKSAGNMIVVQHINGITTEYFHLSKFAEGIKAGARVKQKQHIGNVGTTGMSTGPHLHFGMLRGGAHVDPAKQKFPNAKPVPKEYRGEFDAMMQPLLEQLKALDRA